MSAGKPASLRQLQSRLNEGELLVEYALGSSRSFAFAITRDQAVPYELKGRKEIESAVAAHLQAIRGRRDGRLEAGTVYKLLLEPVALLWHSERLITVPDGKLDMTPLAASVDPQGRYLIETHVISYAPSATVFYMLSAPQRRRSNRVDLLGAGGAYYPSPPSDDKPRQELVGGLFNPQAPPGFSVLRRSSTELRTWHPRGAGTRGCLQAITRTEESLKRLPLSR